MRIPAVCKLLTVLTLTLALGACHSPTERLRSGDLLFVGSSEGAGTMNFLSPDGSLPAYWEELFERLDMPVPQDVPGTNPQDMSLSPLLMDVPNPIPGTRPMAHHSAAQERSF